MKTSFPIRYLAISHEITKALPFDAFAAPNPTLWPTFLWRDRDARELWLGMGWAGVYPTLDACRAALAGVEFFGDPQGMVPRCFAILGFEPGEELHAPWDGFQSRLIVLPEILARVSEERTDFLLLRPFLSDNSATDAETECGCRTAEVRVVLENPQERTHRIARNTGENFSRAQWRQAVETIHEKIRAGEAKKVVLSRSIWREASAPWSVASLLERLATDSDGCYLFGHRLSGDSFIGASPERLFRQSGSELTADSLAGTRPRGNSVASEEDFAHELLHSDKERAEQNHVTEFLRVNMETLCHDVSPPMEPQIRAHTSLQHLFTEVKGRLRDGVELDDVMEHLHPTPAVCGTPREAARELIAALEGEARGLYAGAIGWVSTDEAEFAVTIRSALIAENRATLFAGAGIVAGSDPEAEWEETELKMQPLLRALEG